MVGLLVVTTLSGLVLGMWIHARLIPGRRPAAPEAPEAPAAVAPGKLTVPKDSSCESAFERVLTVSFGLGPHPDDLRNAYLSVNVGEWLSLGEDPVGVIARHFDTSERRVVQALRGLPPN